MAITESLKKLVDQMPDPDQRGMLTENIDKDKIEQTAAEIAGGGKQNVLGLIDMLGEPGHADNVKPHYALHCVVNHALVAGDESLRKAICKTLASQLSNKELIPYNRAYLCQELQWAGRDEACSGLGSVLLEDELTDAAAMALAAIGGERAAAPLRAAATKAKGRQKLNVIDALVALGDEKAADIFENALGDDDPDTRIAAADGWSRLGQKKAIPPLLEAADAAEGWERTQLTRSCLVLAEELAKGGQAADAKQVYDHLKKTRTGEHEQFIRQAVQLGLEHSG